ncbi:hypothetical protein [Magnetospirillum aberrantis]|uniref:AsmA family protein n=1 Tax=Magnetospirillum aberrantis SpK TaxID=908842 RepID=A0A7C9UUF0_9PROT|nr:hypothetical protein [Magnetospirillum aberrantis]NFV79249.1 hypothetical protein [Magnetospirillum aberrantis SpK]
MRKVAIIGGGAAAVVLALVVGIAVFVFSSLDSLVKTAIEKVGSEVAGVPVTVSEVKISLSDGKASIKGLAVGNPKGFTTPKAMSFGEIAVAIDTGSVTGNPVVIKDITVASPEITVELGEKGSNLDVIQANIAGKGGKSGGEASSSSSSSGGEEKKLVIDRLALTNGTVRLATALPDVQSSAKMGDIVLTGIGRKSGGASASEVAEQLLDAVAKSAVKSAKNLGVGNLVDGVAKKAGGVVPSGTSDALKGMFGK